MCIYFVCLIRILNYTAVSPRTHLQYIYILTSEKNITFLLHILQNVFTIYAMLLLNVFNNHFYLYSYSVF